jgi:hypothetical protein
MCEVRRITLLGTSVNKLAAPSQQALLPYHEAWDECFAWRGGRFAN